MSIIEFIRDRARFYNCPVCGRSLKGCDVQVLSHEEERFHLQVTCAQCQVTFIVVLAIAGGAVEDIESIEAENATEPVAVLEPISVKPQELKLTEQLIASLTEPFKPKQYHNEFQDRLRKLIESKQEGKAMEIAPGSKRAPVIDMMTALKKSLAASSPGNAAPKKSAKTKEGKSPARARAS